MKKEDGAYRLCAVLTVLMMVGATFASVSVSAADSDYNGIERRITYDTNAQVYTAIYEDKVVYQGDQEGNYDIYLHDLSTGQTRQITNNTSAQERPDIDGDRIVWMDRRMGNWDIYMYDLSTDTMSVVCSDPANQYYPKIHRNTVVWQDSRHSSMEIYMYNIATSTETRITSNTGLSARPDVYGSRIVWYDDTPGPTNIYMYNIANSTQTQITFTNQTSWFPSIYRDTIVWEDHRNVHADIYVYDVGLEEESRLTTSTGDQHRPQVYKDFVVWQDERDGDKDVYLYDLDAEEEVEICTQDKDQNFPTIHSVGIAWHDYRHGDWEVYVYLWDSDDDGYPNFEDDFPYNPTEHADDDGDGIPNNLDPDANGNGIPDDEEPTCDCEAVRVTYGNLSQYHPAVHEDGIAFVDDNVTWHDITMHDVGSGEEDLLTSDTYTQDNPDIWEDWVVWEDHRHGNPSIYLWDPDAQTERRISPQSASQTQPSIWGNHVVWTDMRNGNRDIYLYNISTQTEVAIATDTVPEYDPCIYEDQVVFVHWYVWETHIHWHVYLYDIFDGTTTQLTPGGAKAAQPCIADGMVVWKDRRDGRWEIYSHDLGDGSETRLTDVDSDKDHPRVSMGKAVWTDDRNGQWDLFLYCFEYGIECPIAPSPSDQQHPDVHGSTIVWQDDRNGPWDIYMCQLDRDGDGSPDDEDAFPDDPDEYLDTDGDGIGDNLDEDDNGNGIPDDREDPIGTCMPCQERRVGANVSSQLNPSVHESRVVWQDYRNGNWDIYMEDLTTGVETRITDDPANQTNPAIYDNYVVWHQSNPPYSTVHLHNLSTGTTEQISTGLACNYPSIYGNHVVYSMDGRHILLYNISSRTTIEISDDARYLRGPSIHGDRVVYYGEDTSATGPGSAMAVYLYEISTGGRTQITHSPQLSAGEYYYTNEPDVFGDTIVWHCTSFQLNPYSFHNGIHTYDIEGGIEQEVLLDIHGGLSKCAIYGPAVVGSGTDIFMECLDTGYVSVICDAPGYQDGADIWGDWVVWHDNRNGDPDVYACFLDCDGDGVGNSEDAFPRNPNEHSDTDGDGIGDNADSDADGNGIPDDREEPIGTYPNPEMRVGNNVSSQMYPQVNDGRAVWQDQRNGNWDIYMEDLSTGVETRLSDDPANETRPAIYGDYVVWQQDGTSSSVHLHNLTTGTTGQISTGPECHGPSIYGNHVAYIHNDRYLYLYNISSRTNVPLSTVAHRMLGTSIHENLVVCHGDDVSTSRHDPFVYMFDITTGQMTQITSDPSGYGGIYDYDCDVFGDMIVFERQNNNYGYANIDYGVFKHDLTSHLRLEFLTDFPEMHEPSIFEKTVVATSGDICLEHLDTGQVSVICNAPGEQRWPDIWGDWVVWQDQRSGEWDIYACFLDGDGDGMGDSEDAFPDNPNEFSDMDGDGIGDNMDPDADGNGIPDEYEEGIFPPQVINLTNDPGNQIDPAIYESLVVWTDRSSAPYGIVLHDLDTGISTRISNESYYQGRPDIHGNYAVWEDYRNANTTIYLYDIEEGKEMDIGLYDYPRLFPAIHGNHVVYTMNAVYTHWTWGVYLYNITSGLNFRLTSYPYECASPDVQGDLVVYAAYNSTDPNDIYHIYLYDRATGQTTRLSEDPFNSLQPSGSYSRDVNLDPAIDGDYVVWHRYYRPAGLTSPYYREHAIVKYNLNTGERETLLPGPEGCGYWPSIHDQQVVYSSVGWRSICIHDVEFGRTAVVFSDTERTQRKNPDIHGDWVVWQDNINGNWEIFAAHLDFDNDGAWNSEDAFPYNPHETADTDGDGIGDNADDDADGDGMADVYSALTDRGDTYLFNTRRLTYDDHDQRWPAIYGDLVVWEDHRNGDGTVSGNADIYLYNISSDETRQITTDSSWQGKPAIWDDTIVWIDHRNPPAWDLYKYDLTTETESRIPTSALTVTGWVPPQIYMDKLVYIGIEVNYDEGAVYDQVWVLNLTTGVDTRISPSHIRCRDIAIWGDSVIIRGDDTTDEYQSYFRIYRYDLEDGTFQQISEDHYLLEPSWIPEVYGHLDIYGKYAVWYWGEQPDPDYDDYIDKVIVHNIETGTEWWIWPSDQDQYWPSIHGERIVFDGSILYELNFGNDMSCQFADGSLLYQEKPNLWGDWVVWEDYLHGDHSEIFLYFFDADGDGVGDTEDAFPTNPLEQHDTDGDGIGDNSDPDADGDGVIDQLFALLQMDAPCTFEGERLSPDDSGAEDATVYKDRVVWTDYRHDVAQVYYLNMTTGVETRISPTGSDQMVPHIWEDIIVWTDMRHHGSVPSEFNYEIYAYNISNATAWRVTTRLGYSACPRIYQKMVVYHEADYGGTYNVRLLDLETGVDAAVAAGPHHQIYPDIYGEWAVWEEQRGTSREIFLHNISAGATVRLTQDENQDRHPVIIDDKVYWLCKDAQLAEVHDELNTHSQHGDSITFYSISTGQTETIVSGYFGGDFAMRTGLAPWGDMLLFEQYTYSGLGTMDSDIFIYNHDTGNYKRIIESTGSASRPSMYGDWIVWDDDRTGTRGVYGAFFDCDGDGVGYSQDEFPLNPYEWRDTDGDGIGDNLDPDADDDGVWDQFDAFPLDPTETRDTDWDGIGDNADTDDDNDGVPDSVDAFPRNPDEYSDSDGDGIGDNTDGDDDNDGIPDDQEPGYFIDPKLTKILDIINTTALQVSNQTASIEQSKVIGLAILELLDSVGHNFSAEMTGLNSSLQHTLSVIGDGFMDELRSVNGSLAGEIEAHFTNLLIDLGGLNSTLRGELDLVLEDLLDDNQALSAWLVTAMADLDWQLAAVNDSLHAKLDALDGRLDAFHASLQMELSGIMTQLILSESNVSGGIAPISDDIAAMALLVANLEDETLAGISDSIAQLAEDLEGYDASVAARLSAITDAIDSFKADMMGDLEDINGTLEDMAKLDTIIADVQALDDALGVAHGELSSSIEGKGDDQMSRSTINTMLLLVVFVLLLVVMANQFMMARRMRETPLPDVHLDGAEMEPDLEPVEIEEVEEER